MVEKLIEMGSTLVLLDTETETTRVLPLDSMGTLRCSHDACIPVDTGYLRVHYVRQNVVLAYTANRSWQLPKRDWPFIEWDKTE